MKQVQQDRNLRHGKIMNVIKKNEHLKVGLCAETRESLLN